MNIELIYPLYGSGIPKQLAVHDSSRGDDDIRLVYILKYTDKEKIAVKITNNSFTTRERVIGWAELIDHYNRLGIYCPAVLHNKNDELFSVVDGYLIYAEEFMKYKPASEQNNANNLCEKYAQKLYESIGLVAANPAPVVPWHTAYCIYDKFDENDITDENYECAEAFYKCFATHYPQYTVRAEAILSEYKTRRIDFEKYYRALPVSVFQGDINDTNILLTRSGNFKGLIDFNLSGTETILNYAFCECFECLRDESEIEILTDTLAMRHRDEKTAQRLAWIAKNYKFTDVEKYAFNEYYNIFAPFRWPYHCFFIKLLTNQDKYPDGGKYAEVILDWIEHQMHRRDVGQLLP
jgi:hypothetical protein